MIMRASHYIQDIIKKMGGQCVSLEEKEREVIARFTSFDDNRYEIIFREVC